MNEENQKEKPSYYAYIPAVVRYDKNLSAGAKLFFGEITCLQDKYGYCYASNNYFSKLYEVNPSCISHWIKALEKEGFIALEYLRSGKEITERRIYLTDKILKQSVGGSEINNNVVKKTQEGIEKNAIGYLKKDKENITSVNNINMNNTSIREKEIKKKFIKPTISEIQAYCQERQNGIDAEYFYDWYEARGWMSGKTKMSDWQAAVRTWERNNKKQTNSTYQNNNNSYKKFDGGEVPDFIGGITNGN